MKIVEKKIVEKKNTYGNILLLYRGEKSMLVREMAEKYRHFEITYH